VASYYYLAAQLPFLIYGQPPPMSSRAFRELCREKLNAADGALLDICVLDPDPAGIAPGGAALFGVGSSPAGPSYTEAPPITGSDFIDRWRAWERALRLNLARYRFQRLRREGAAAAEAPDYPADAAAAAKAAAALESPLEAELFLDKSRWDAIENFRGLHYFGRNTIYAYLLQLLLMERRSLFKTEEGFREYKGLYASILEKAGTAPISNESGEPK
jgi:hypothetical protein